MALRNILFMTLGLLIWNGCNPEASTTKKEDKSTSVDTIYEQNERQEEIKYLVQAGTQIREGHYWRKNAQGQLLEEADYVDGKLHGRRILYYPGTLDTQIVETYAQGLFHGPYRLLYPDGKLQYAGSYTDNQLEGIWTKYYENGQPKEEVTFSQNLENGPFKEYYPEGGLQVQGTYRNGDKEHGLLEFYDTTGKLIKTMECVDGVCRTKWKLK